MLRPLFNLQIYAFFSVKCDLSIIDSFTKTYCNSHANFYYHFSSIFVIFHLYLFHFINKCLFWCKTEIPFCPILHKKTLTIFCICQQALIAKNSQSSFIYVTYIIFCYIMHQYHDMPRCRITVSDCRIHLFRYKSVC